MGLRRCFPTFILPEERSYDPSQFEQSVGHWLAEPVRRFGGWCRAGARGGAGRVPEAGGRPIAGAQVTVVGTNLGTTTGDDGRFTLLVPAGQRTVRALAIGFKVGQVQVTVTPGGTTTANAELTRSVLSLDEVVVTGTGGAATKRELGSSIATINIAAEVREPPASMDQMLRGQTAGLAVLQTGASGPYWP